MSKCTVKMSVDICGESALDAVTRLVVDNGMSVNKACKQVAEEFNATNEGATVKPNTLRSAYNRAQKVDACIKSKKKKTTPKIPVVDNTTTKCDCEALKARIKVLEELLEVATVELEKHVLAEAKAKDAPSPGSLKREKAIEFILEHGNKLQTDSIKIQNPTNNRLFGLFSVVRQRYLEVSPPQSLPKEIVEATSIVV